MKPINDPRLPNTTHLPDEVSLEAVVRRKADIEATDLLAVFFEGQSERVAINSETNTARRNGWHGRVYSDAPPGCSSTRGCPADPSDSPKLATDALAPR